MDQLNNINKTTYKQHLLDQLRNTYKNSDKCHVGYNERKHIVFGQGNANATLMLIGEAPGKEEDEQGVPFVGRSGMLLNKALDVAQINREDIYITNVLKCRPPSNRTPTEQEIQVCTQYFLDKQIKIIRPKIIATLGAIATKVLLSQDIKITKIHGQIFKKDDFIIIPIYHPSYILRNRTALQGWIDDIKKLKEISDAINNNNNNI
ncbi:MAG: uracil-DNA glycosylase [Novosphingobium sp.]|nr:uracil-DNA glycosylase [Novosphingobium sp.]